MYKLPSPSFMEHVTVTRVVHAQRERWALVQSAPDVSQTLKHTQNTQLGPSV